MRDTFPVLPIRWLIVCVLAFAIGACATTARGKLADADEALTSAITLSAILLENDVISQADKPRLRACFKVAEAAIAESRAQLLAGVDSKPAYKLALKYIGVAQSFLDNHRGDLSGCTS